MSELTEALNLLRSTALTKLAARRGLQPDSALVQQLVPRMPDDAVIAELTRTHQRLSWWRNWFYSNRS